MAKKEKKKGGALRVLRNILIGIVVFLLVFVLAVRGYFRIPVASYYKDSVKGFTIPGLSGNFIPQGLSYDTEGGKFFITGYTTDGTVCPLYIVDKESGDTEKCLYLKDADGSDYTAHAGGLSVYGDYVYVAGSSEGTLNVYSYADAMEASDEDSLNCLGTFNTGINVAYTTVSDGKLFVGEFYREANYPTEDSHKMTTTGGDYNQSLAIAYEFSDAEDAVFGLNTTPVLAVSTPDMVQGLAFNNGKVYASTSYGPAFSNIYAYDWSKADNQKTYVFNDVELPLYELDSASLSYSEKIAPQSEEIEFVDGRMYTMCEAASNKYKFGKFTSAKYCYATEME